MKFVKIKSAFGKYQPSDTPVQFENDSEADFVISSGVGEAAEAPKEVATKAMELEDKLVTRIADKLVGQLSTLETKSTGRRPNYNITTHDNELDDPTDGFKHHGEFAKAVHKACVGGGMDKRLEIRLKANGASEGVSADGGFATPVEFAQTVYNDIIAQDSLMNSCFTIPMASASIKLPAINYTQQGVFGVTANWEGEGASIPTSKPPYRQPQLVLNKLTILAPVTSELLEDGLAVESTINFLASEALTYKINDAIINGTGAGQPAGVVGYGSTVAVARNTTVTVKAIDVIKMNSVFLGNENRAEWLISKGDVTPQLLTIQDAGGRYLYFAPGTFGDNKGPANMLGMRVRPLINCQPLGTTGDIILWDPKTYVIGYKSTGINKAMSIHLYFQTDEVAFRWTFRMDGRPWRDTTLAAAKGSSIAYGGAIVLTTL